MATLAETLGAQSVQQPDITGNVQKGLQTGVQLATAAETIESEKVKLAQQKEQLSSMQFQKVSNMLEKISQATPAARKRIATAYRGQLQQMNIPMSDATFEDLVQDQDLSNNIASLNRSGLLQRIGQNEQAREEVFSALVDEMGFSAAVKQVMELNKTAENNELRAQLANERNAALASKREADLSNKINDKVVAEGNKAEANLKKLREQGLALDQVGTLIAQARNGNSISANAVGTKLARAMGEVGALTESDVTRYVSNGAILPKTGDILNKWLEGKPSDATLEEINQITSILSSKLKDKYQDVLKPHVQRMVGNYGLSEEEAYSRLGYPELYKAPKASKASADGYEEFAAKAKQVAQKAGRTISDENIKQAWDKQQQGK